MIEHLFRACDICEHTSAVAALRQIIFSDGRLSAFNGVIQYQAPTGLDRAERFAVAEGKLANALRSCGEEVKISATKDFLKLVNGPLSVRVRKSSQDFSDLERIALPKEAASQDAAPIRAALLKVSPFVSTDASRPWSVAALIKDGFAWATNNLALVRSPVPNDLPEMRIPYAMVNFLCALPEVFHWHIDDKKRLIFSTAGRALIRCPQSAAEWPDVSRFFAKKPKTLLPIPPEMSEAARTVGKFADRFISMNPKQVESRQESIESDYEVDFAKGKGTYSAKLLTLILEHATHADFSFYPDPIFFAGEALEGTAVGMKTA